MPLPTVSVSPEIQWPCGGSASKKCDVFPPPHGLSPSRAHAEYVKEYHILERESRRSYFGINIDVFESGVESILRQPRDGGEPAVTMTSERTGHWTKCRRP